jgi:hypothetical protein
MVFVMAEEILHLPDNVFAVLSTKRKLAMAGIIVTGGHVIDPGYHGKLVFGLYNFASEPFTLIPGKKLIAATFCELSSEEIGYAEERRLPPEAIHEFSPELIERMIKFYPLGLKSIQNQVTEMEKALYDLRKTSETQDLNIAQIRDISDKITREVSLIAAQIGDLTENINKTNDSVSELRQSLEMETLSRENEDRVIKSTLSSMKWVIGISIAIATVLVTVIFIAAQILF